MVSEADIEKQRIKAGYKGTITPYIRKRLVQMAEDEEKAVKAKVSKVKPEKKVKEAKKKSKKTRKVAKTIFKGAKRIGSQLLEVGGEAYERMSDFGDEPVKKRKTTRKTTKKGKKKPVSRKTEKVSMSGRQKRAEDMQDELMGFM